MKDDDLLAVMGSFVGVVEKPIGSNKTKIGAEYGYNGVPWCAEAVSVACNRLGFPLHEAAVIRIEAHARAGDWGMGWSKTPVKASAVCFDWEGHGNPADMHTGIVTEVLDGGRFRTIEGNYHDRCTAVLRDMKYVRGFATFPFESSAAPAQPAPSTKSIFGPWPHVPKDVIRRGAKGEVVRYLQHVISARAGGNISIDGDFGRQTESRVVDVQRFFKATADGVVGPQTWGIIDFLAMK